MTSLKTRLHRFSAWLRWTITGKRRFVGMDPAAPNGDHSATVLLEQDRRGQLRVIKVVYPKS